MYSKRGQGIEVLPKNMLSSTFFSNKDSYHENPDGDANLQSFSFTQLVPKKSHKHR
jgi:hypothetical protein